MNESKHRTTSMSSQEKGRELLKVYHVDLWSRRNREIDQNSGTQRGEGKVLTYFSLQPRSERAMRTPIIIDVQVCERNEWRKFRYYMQTYCTTHISHTCRVPGIVPDTLHGRVVDASVK